jgi:hypothetical protein
MYYKPNYYYLLLLSTPTTNERNKYPLEDLVQEINRYQLSLPPLICFFIHVLFFRLQSEDIYYT